MNRQENIIRTPGFTAEASVYKSTGRYLMAPFAPCAGGGAVTVALTTGNTDGITLCPGADCRKGNCNCCCMPGQRCVRGLDCCYCEDPDRTGTGELEIEVQPA